MKWICKLDAFSRTGPKGQGPVSEPGKIPERSWKPVSKRVTDDAGKKLINRDTSIRPSKNTRSSPSVIPSLKRPLKQAIPSSIRPVGGETRHHFERYRGLEVEKEMLVSEQDVEDQLNQIRKAHGKIIALESDRTVKKRIMC